MNNLLFYAAVVKTFEAFKLSKENALGILDIYITSVCPDKVDVNTCDELRNYVNEKYDEDALSSTASDVMNRYRRYLKDEDGLSYSDFASILVYEYPKTLKYSENFMNPPTSPEFAPEFDGSRDSLEKYLKYQDIELSVEEIDSIIPEAMRETFPTDLCARVYEAVTNYFM